MANTYDDYFKERANALAKIEAKVARDAHNPYLMREYINTANGLLFAVMNVVERLADKEEEKEEERAAPVEATIATMQRIIGNWAEKTFPQSTTSTIMRHLWMEMVELDQAVERNSSPAVCEEVADIFGIICHLCLRMQINLEAAVREKHAVNLKREWQPPDAGGVVYHQKAAHDLVLGTDGMVSHEKEQN